MHFVNCNHTSGYKKDWKVYILGADHISLKNTTVWERRKIIQSSFFCIQYLKTFQPQNSPLFFSNCPKEKSYFWRTVKSPVERPPTKKSPISIWKRVYSYYTFQHKTILLKKNPDQTKFCFANLPITFLSDWNISMVSFEMLWISTPKN